MTSSNNKNFLFISLICLVFGSSVSLIFFKVPSILPEICNEFNVDNATASNLMSAYTFSSFLLALPCGFISKKIGTKKALSIAVAVCFAGSILGVIAKYFGQAAFELLMISRVMEGMLNVFACVCVPIMIMRVVSPKHVGLSIGIFAIWMSIGSILSQILTPALVGIFGISNTWLIYALYLALSFLLVLKFVGGNHETRSDLKEQKELGSTACQKPLVFSIVLYLFMYVVLCMTQTSALNFMPIGFKIFSNVDGSLAGLLTSIPAIFTIFSQIVCGAICDRVKGYKYILVVCAFGQSIGIFLMFYSSTLPLYLLGAILSGICYGSFAVASIVTEDLFGRKNLEIGQSIVMCIGGAGQFLASTFGLALLGPDMLNFELEAFVLAGLCIVAGVATLLIRPRYLRDKKQSVN